MRDKAYQQHVIILFRIANVGRSLAWCFMTKTEPGTPNVWHGRNDVEQQQADAQQSQSMPGVPQLQPKAPGTRHSPSVGRFHDRSAQITVKSHVMLFHDQESYLWNSCRQAVFKGPRAAWARTPIHCFDGGRHSWR